MKKEKKEKGPKKKWSVFKTIVVVFASFIFVVGVVLGGIYLAGGLRKKHTAPQSIQLELCSDADLYDPIKARYNSGTGQIEATADFWLVVTSPTAEITEDIIELTLSDNKGGNNSEIRNDSIRVPRYVTIGVPFKVTALTAPLKNSDGQADRLGLSYDEEGYILKEEGKPDKVEMIKGGISTLTATSTAVRVNPPSTNIKIAVDTPVYKVGTILTTIGGEELTIDENIYQITQNDKFKADMIFFPEKSEYMFGETKEMENPRTKLSFFQTKGKIDMNIGSDGVTFVGTELSSDTTAEAIDGYAFESASDQVELFLTSFKRDWQDEAFLRLVDEYCVSKNFSVFNGVDTIITSEDRFYTTMLSAFPSENKASCTDSARVDVVEATVDNFEVDFRGFGSDADDYMKTNSDYTLYVNGEHNPDENKLSLMAQAFAKNVPITNLLANVAIRFKYFAGEWQDVDLNQPNAQISVRGGETVVVDGKTYLCPNTDVADLNYAYYTIHTTSNFSFQMEVVLIIHGKNGENTIFKNSATTYEFIAKPAPETDNVYWTISDLTMQLSGEGDVFSSPVNLEQYSVAPSGQTKVYFAYFGDEAGNAKFNADRIIGANAYEENRVGTYGGLYLFPLVNHNLIAISAGQFDLYFATIRTTSDGHTPEYDDGLYSINKITSEPIKVKALRSLYSESVGNLNAYISPTNDLVSDDSNIYVYNGSNVGLHLEFTIKEDSRDVFATELKNGNIRLRILNSLGEDISTYFSGSELTTDLNGVSLVYNLTFVGLGRGVSEVTIGDAKLEFEELSWSKLIKHQDTKNIVLYTPTPEKIEVQLTGIEDTVPVPVEQTLSPEGVFETSIGDMEIGGTILDWINQHITITVTDNKDNQKVFENSWRFETSDAKALMISADGHSFTFGTVEGSATLSVSCGTATRKTVVTFEISATGLTELDYSTSDQIDDDLTTNPDAKRTVSGYSK